MKKLLSILIAFAIMSSTALATISIKDSPADQDSKLAADEFGAEYAYFSPYDDYIYYLKSTFTGTEVIVFDADKSEYKTIQTFTPDADYVSVCVDGEGSIYILRQDKDETAKSGIVCLVKDGESYYLTEYLFPGASGELVPAQMEISPYSSCGAIRLWFNHKGDYIPAICALSVFWGALTGYDELIAIEPGSLSAKLVKLEDFYDVYGYENETIENFLDSVSGGSLLLPSHASLSPNGNMLLMTVPYQGETLVYAMDVYSYALQIVYPPDNFSGSVYWLEDNTIAAESGNGDVIHLSFKGFDAGDWSDIESPEFFVNPSQGWSDESLSDWNNVTDEELDNWA